MELQDVTDRRILSARTLRSRCLAGGKTWRHGTFHLTSTDHVNKRRIGTKFRDALGQFQICAVKLMDTKKASRRTYTHVTDSWQDTYVMSPRTRGPCSGNTIAALRILRCRMRRVGSVARPTRKMCSSSWLTRWRQHIKKLEIWRRFLYRFGDTCAFLPRGEGRVRGEGPRTLGVERQWRRWWRERTLSGW